MTAPPASSLPPRNGGRDYAFWVASWFGAGMFPVAPATAGTLAALPLHLLLVQLPSWAHLLLLLLLVAIAFPCVAATAARLGEKDPQVVVVDESASILLALWIAAPADPLQFVATVVLFRILDIFKPWPLLLLERLRPPALGIMADDLAAGVLAGLIVRALAALMASAV